MNHALITLMIVFLFGCATTYETARANNRTKLNQLSIGMEKATVLNIMGTKTISVEVAAFVWDKITNPYRTESFMSPDGKQVDILYYYTDQKASDGAITDDELTPLVFHNGKLIGWGWRVLEDVKAKYEIRMR